MKTSLPTAKKKIPVCPNSFGVQRQALSVWFCLQHVAAISRAKSQQLVSAGLTAPLVPDGQELVRCMWIAESGCTSHPWCLGVLESQVGFYTYLTFSWV